MSRVLEPHSRMSLQPKRYLSRAQLATLSEFLVGQGVAFSVSATCHSVALLAVGCVSFLLDVPMQCCASTFCRTVHLFNGSMSVSVHNGVTS